MAADYRRDKPRTVLRPGESGGVKEGLTEHADGSVQAVGAEAVVQFMVGRGAVRGSVQ